MLSRLLVEDVRLRVRPEETLTRINASPKSMEQILLNLAVKVRSTVLNGGRLAIATSKAEKDEGSPRVHAEAAAGRHICLALSETGLGVRREVATRIFEPFFTTTIRAMAPAWPPPGFRGSSSRALSTCRASRGRARPSRSTCLWSRRQPTNT
jgi:C4-dicarboxylate-specific signal transduction histidine kinase